MLHTYNAARQWQGHAHEHGSKEHRAWGMAAWGMAGAVQRMAGQSRAEHLDCRKKRTASPERAATRRAEGKDVSSARAWPNLRNFGQRRGNLEGVSDCCDALHGVGAFAKTIQAAELVA